MILVDSSAWIDYFRGAETSPANILDNLLGTEDLAIGDLILVEVLQGFAVERDFRRAQRMLTALTLVDLCGPSIAIHAARNFRRLRSLGVTVRKTVDCVIATYCIENSCELLHNDRVFDAFEAHLRLQVRR